MGADIRFNVAAVDQLETLALQGGTGNDTFTNAAGSGGTRLEADMLATQGNTLTGNAGNDTFTLQWDAAFNLDTTQSLIIDGGAAATRDVVNLQADDVADGVRAIGLTYLGGGNVDVTGLRDGGGIVDVNAVEQLNYSGDGVDNDVVTVTGTVGDDVLSITPLSPTTANVFLDGSPLLDGAATLPTANKPRRRGRIDGAGHQPGRFANAERYALAGQRLGFQRRCGR